MKKLATFHIIIAIILVSLTDLSAQRADEEERNNAAFWKGIIYRTERAIDLRLHPNGYAIGMSFGDIRTYYKTKYYQIEIGRMFDPREESQNRNLAYFVNELSNSFKYGKVNEMMVVRGGVGRKIFISEKQKRKGIAIGYKYEVGPSIAVLKPYYLDLIYKEQQDMQVVDRVRSEKYSEENAEKFLDINSIYGSSGFRKGWGELSFIPGLQAKGALFFSLGAFDKYIKSIEVGAMADVYIRKVPIMAETEAVSNKPYFINLYLNLHIGRRK